MGQARIKTQFRVSKLISSGAAGVASAFAFNGSQLLEQGQKRLYSVCEFSDQVLVALDRIPVGRRIFVLRFFAALAMT